MASVRIINNLIRAIEERRTLPKLLIVIMDRDGLRDMNVFEDTVPTIIHELIRWTVQQIDMVVCHTRSNFLKVKPGANVSTKIIYVRMLRRVGKFSDESKMKAICEFRAKVNDALNDSITKMGQYILTINSCNAYEHFDRSGNLSLAGKKAF